MLLKNIDPIDDRSIYVNKSIDCKRPLRKLENNNSIQSRILNGDENTSTESTRKPKYRSRRESKIRDSEAISSGSSFSFGMFICTGRKFGGAFDLSPYKDSRSTDGEGFP